MMIFKLISPICFSSRNKRRIVLTSWLPAMPISLGVSKKMFIGVIDDQEKIDQESFHSQERNGKIRHEIHQNILRCEVIDFDPGRMPIY